MNYATTYSIGDHPNSRRKTTKIIASPVGGICNMDTKTQRCHRNQKGQKEISSPLPIANAFLKTTLMPKLEIDTVEKPPREIKILENDFYRSLNRLTDHYGKIELTDTRLFSYPCNIAYSIWETENFLKKNFEYWDCLRLVQDTDKAYLACEERLFTGATLYYIPIVPLFLMLRDKSRKKTAHLLLSVFAYLYHIANVPYYRQKESFLYWEYEMLGNWIDEDEENDVTQNYKCELSQAEWIGDRIEQKLFNIKNLLLFKERLNRYKSRDDFDDQCKQVAQNALNLYEEYPDTTYYRNARPQMGIIDMDGEECEEETITMDRYVSFYADSRGWLSASLCECINNEFNEYGKVEEPAICKRFDGSPLTKNNLDFEKRLFTLMDDLIYLLNNFKRKSNE